MHILKLSHAGQTSFLPCSYLSHCILYSSHSMQQTLTVWGGWLLGFWRAPDRIPPSSPDYRDRLEQVERQRERDRKLREQQQKEQREQKERERRAEERRKEREARREGQASHTRICAHM